MLAKILNRHVILPKFHCYIGEPATCNMDALFDTYGMQELGYFENSFLENPLVPKENIRSEKVFLAHANIQQKPRLKDILRHFERSERKNAPLLEVVFPESVLDGPPYPHFALANMADRFNGEWGVFSKEIEKKVKYNDELLFAPWYTYWKKDLSQINYTCLVTGEMNINRALSHIQSISPENALYVVSTNPGFPTSPKLYVIKDLWAPWVVWGYEFLWAGHRLMQGHTSIIQLQMEACHNAQHVVINGWEPGWLVEEICEMRKEIGKSNCLSLINAS